MLASVGHAGKVSLENSVRVFEGTVISRPEALTGKPVVTIAQPDYRVFQFSLDEVAVIESATEGIEILKETAVVQAGTDESAPPVRRFTAGMEFLVQRKEGDWAFVVPMADGLRTDQGWLPASTLTSRLDLEALRAEAAKEAAPVPEEATGEISPPAEGSEAKPETPEGSEAKPEVEGSEAQGPEDGGAEPEPAEGSEAKPEEEGSEAKPEPEGSVPKPEPSDSGPQE
jgi:hypothetical protein